MRKSQISALGRSLRIAPFLVLPLIACSVGAPGADPTERVGSGAQAIVGGTADSASASANIVVALEQPNATQAACTGTLLTPTLVITSRTCVGTGRAGSRPVVRVGATRAASRVYRAVRDSVVMGAHNADDPAGADPRGELALVFLDPSNPVVEDVAIPHQELAQIYGTDTQSPNGLDYENMSVAGWSPTGGSTAATTRQHYDYPVAKLLIHWLANDDQPFWVRNATDNLGRLVDADLGGPLYRVNAAGDRQIVGVAALFNASSNVVSTCPAGATSCDVWNDVTFDPSREWIWRNARVPKTDANAHWFDTHPSAHRRADGTPDWWEGEVDYTGPCDRARDSDCDHWFDKNADQSQRDNCPNVTNVTQADRDDDGVGDACDTCPAIPQNMCDAQGVIAERRQAAKMLAAKIEGMRLATRCGAEGQQTVGDINAKLLEMAPIHDSAMAALAILRGAGGTSADALQAVEQGEAAMLDIDTARYAAKVAAQDANTEASLPSVAAYVSKPDASCVTPDAPPIYKSLPNVACGNIQHWAVDERCGHATYTRGATYCTEGSMPKCNAGDTELSGVDSSPGGLCGSQFDRWPKEHRDITCRVASSRACWILDGYQTCRTPANGIDYYPTCSKPGFGIASYNACHTAATPVINSGGAGMSKWSNGFAGASWPSFTATPRVLADVNGDGKADIVGFGAKGVKVALATDGRFKGESEWISIFATQADIYTSFDSYPRFAADANGDGKADIIAFGNDGTYVALSTGSSFAPPSRWTTDFGFAASRLNWNEYPHFVGDLNGDGKADVAQMSNDGVWVALSTGATFGAPSRWTTQYSYNAGWGSQDALPKFFSDVDGDGKADLVGLASDGAYVALSTGAGFATAQRWGYQFAINDGWPGQSSTTRGIADVNGDGRGDVVGFSANGEMWVSLSTGSGFEWARPWAAGIGVPLGLSTFNATPRLLGDVTGDKRADLVEFASDGAYVSRALPGERFGL